jgi:hypothetical protein
MWPRWNRHDCVAPGGAGEPARDETRRAPPQPDAAPQSPPFAEPARKDARSGVACGVGARADR